MDAEEHRTATQRVLFFDGVCVFCNRAVERLLQIDRDEHFVFASLQGETARRARAHHPEIPQSIETLVLLDDHDVHMRTDALVRIARALPYPWRLLSLLRVIPRFIRERLYVAFARRRYQMFGRREACMVPAPEHRSRFLP